MIIGGKTRGLLHVVAAAIVLSATLLFGVHDLRAAGDDTPLWQRTVYRQPGFDRSFKCDLVETQSLAPQVVFYGGSRALRMPPSEIKRRTGQSAFNAAFHNGRPTDWWAFTNYLVERDPATPPCTVFCVQTTNFGQAGLHQGLILDARLSAYFPSDLIAAQEEWAKRQGVHNLLGSRRFSRYGAVTWNSYDARRAAGVTLQRVLDTYLDADMLAKAGNKKTPGNTRDMRYFEKTLKLLNERGVKPLVVIMPYHPRVLKAFYSVGWGVKQRWIVDYLKSLRTRYKIGVLNCVRISTWGGSSREFYDGSHLTRANSERLTRYCVRKAPGCFRLHPEWLPTPTPSPSPSESASGEPSPSGSPL